MPGGAGVAGRVVVVGFFPVVEVGASVLVVVDCAVLVVVVGGGG